MVKYLVLSTVAVTGRESWSNLREVSGLSDIHEKWGLGLENTNYS